ncbi:MAG TPA: hypothetical protein VHY08_19915 [Bacillota bacterium]|nr:hypothetical protein [Bacillota bacterium]
MTSSEAPGLINSDWAFGFLLKNKTVLTVYLEDGTVLRGTVLGKDEVFLIIMENTILHLAQISKIIRIQTEVNVDSIAELLGKTGNQKPKVIPVINDQNNPPPLASSAEDNSNKEHFKNRLDQLVRNW